ncbi:UNVERIFIED_CONTAM: hypothetical protein PYX00_010756 [Menopon gallinae]|uniref:DNA-binding protein D-ETS-4 n=1 Tax=Menopon gallinae TaxID=328185 RepID=A0AAW2HGJ0_9NEOP
MSTAVRSNFFREAMPQTVPSAGFTPPYCDYSVFTTDFDLSLLPVSPESQVPLSPTQLSPYLSLYPPSPPTFSGNLEEGIFCDSIGFGSIKSKAEEPKNECEDEQPLHTPLKKSLSSGFFREKMDVKEKDDKYGYYAKKEEEKFPLRPLIPTTVQASTSYYPVTIKQEPNFGVDFGRESDYRKPRSTLPYAIKTEKTVDLQEVLKESQYLQNATNQSKQYATLQNLLKVTKTEAPESKPSKSDHQLLRSVLRDTSFQKKFNIKPFDVPSDESSTASGYRPDEKEVKMEGESSGGSKNTEGSEIVEELTSEKIEPVFSLAIEQIRQDVDNTCNILGIASDPMRWTEEDVKAWLLWTVRQFSLPMINTDCFHMDGAAFCQLTEEEFQQRAPQSCSTLHAHLEVWKAAANCGNCSTTGSQDLSRTQWSPTMHSSGSSTGGDLSEDEDEDMESFGGQSKPGTSAQSPDASTSSGKARGSSGSHIHLWQFLKELLASPQVHGSCIRWLDRQKGVFKIEDSVRVARLWGKRKNRPAMNYDKLSRSIRQYYKKGIMKKTERSQRLVYQFCHPYCL